MLQDAQVAGYGVAFAEPLILLVAAVIGVAISRRLGLGSVLGYLAAGAVIGPITRLISDAEEIMHVAELGIVLFLFLIGMELRPARLWSMRTDIFGLGLAQLLLTGVLLTGLFVAIGWRAEPALIIGFGLAMSSTAFGMQSLAERNELTTPYGQKAVSILLFQDIAIVPLLALVPILAPDGEAFASGGFAEVLKSIAALAALLLAGRFLLNPLFRILAVTGAREIMTAAALLVVLGSAALMDAAGMSMAMGAFIAGLMLADSAFRHALEAEIEPFRSVLLGLFFLSVGMSINLDTILNSWWRIALAVPVVMLLKASVIYGLTRLFGSGHNDAVRTALLLPQAGEFAFVLFASASAVRALWPSETSFVAGIVTVTMALTPFALMLNRFLIRSEEGDDSIEEDFEGAGGSVLVIGFGRFGQIVSQVLLAQHIDATLIDASAERVRQASRFGFRIYFGDGTRRDVLRAAGAEKASVICVCVAKPQVSDRIVDLIKSEFPNAKVYVRSYDRTHTLELLAKGVDYEMRETFESAMVFGGEALRGLGLDPILVEEVIEDVRRRDADRITLQRSGGIHAGREEAPAAPVMPEPFVRPTRRHQDDPPSGRSGSTARDADSPAAE
jgi:CPA2 family monovalent cation:H+ antiporter-2